MDEYIVCIEEDGHHFYYKNGKLHREVGPAYFGALHEKEYTNLSDEKLYKKVFVYTVDEKQYTVPINSDPDSVRISYRPLKANYHLEGKQYNEKEFAAIQLEKELPSINANSKKLKI